MGPSAGERMAWLRGLPWALCMDGMAWSRAAAASRSVSYMPSWCTAPR